MTTILPTELNPTPLAFLPETAGVCPIPPAKAAEAPAIGFALIAEDIPGKTGPAAALPPPQEVATATLQQAEAKLSALQSGLEQSAKTATAAEDSALFDLYSLLRLLATVAQEQRDAAKAMRKAASAQSKIALQEQIDLQRSAAYTGLAMGLSACAISVTMQVANLSLSTTAKVKQEQLGRQLGLPEAQKAYAREVAIETRDAKLLAKESAAADKQLVKLLGENEAATFKASLAEAPALVNARQRVADARQRLDTARNELLAAPQDQARHQAMDEALTHYREAAGTYQTALKTQCARYQAAAESAPQDPVAQAKARTAALYLRQESATLFSGTGAGALTPETPATRHFNLIQAAVQNDPVTKRWGAIATVSQAMSQITMSVGQTLNVTAQQVGQLQGAKASEAGAASAKSRAAADAAAALFAQEADVIASVLEMIKGILQAENQSMETILRA